MDDNNDQLLSGKTVLSHVRKTDKANSFPRLQNTIDHKDGRPASPDSKDAGDQDSLLDNQIPKDQDDDPVIPQTSTLLSINADPALASILSALNQTNNVLL